MHVAGGNHADSGPIVAQREGDVQAPSGIGLTQGVIAWFVMAVALIGKNQKRLIEKNLLGLGQGDVMLIDALAPIAFVPIEAGDPVKIDHPTYITIIYDGRQAA